MSNSKSKAQVFVARLFSTIMLMLLVGGTFLSNNKWVYMSLICLLSMTASMELLKMLRANGIAHQKKLSTVLSFIYPITVCLILATAGRQGLTMVHNLDGTLIASAVLISFALQLREPIDGVNSLIAISTTILSFLYVPFLFSFMARILFLPDIVAVLPGVWLLIWLIVVTKITDIGAYCTGSLIGKHKMIPHISPGKTWQGFGGAILWSVIAGCVLYGFKADQLSILGGWYNVFFLCVILSLCTVVGDLAESVIKRSLSTKDSGSTLPGIGGALDLIDSLCFTAPVLYFYLLWLAKIE